MSHFFNSVMILGLLNKKVAGRVGMKTNRAKEPQCQITRFHLFSVTRHIFFEFIMHLKNESIRQRDKNSNNYFKMNIILKVYKQVRHYQNKLNIYLIEIKNIL